MRLERAYTSCRAVELVATSRSLQLLARLAASPMSSSSASSIRISYPASRSRSSRFRRSPSCRPSRDLSSTGSGRTFSTPTWIASPTTRRASLSIAPLSRRRQRDHRHRLFSRSNATRPTGRTDEAENRGSVWPRQPFVACGHGETRHCRESWRGPGIRIAPRGGCLRAGA